ncbi:MAG: ABC transporter permease [Clostridium sp.]
MKTIQTLKDVLTMSGRCLLLSKRNPDTILTSIIAPILTMLLFAYVIGGAMQTGETSYVNFIVPGIILQCLGQCAATTAIAVCSDIKSGIMERFCTMPVKRSSILNGHVLEAFIRNMVTALLILLVAFLIGFRPEADLLGWCAALLIISLYILTLSWISVYFGMIANSPEGQAHSQFWRSLCPASAPASYQSTPCRKHCRFLPNTSRLPLSLIHCVPCF